MSDIGHETPSAEVGVCAGFPALRNRLLPLLSARRWHEKKTVSFAGHVLIIRTPEEGRNRPAFTSGPQGRKETAVYDRKDTILAVDYHAENTEVRWLNCHSGEERRLNMQWVCQIPRYREAFERSSARHGKNIARIIVARMLLRSIFKMLHDGVRFNQVSAA